MAIGVEIKALTRNIAFSHKDRMKRIGEIRKEVKGTRVEARNMVHSFADSHQERNRQLRQDLARDKARRKSETTAILKEVSARIRKDLSRGTSERQAGVKKAAGDSRKLIKGFSISRQNVSYELKKDLARSGAKATGEVEQILSDARNLVKGFQTSRIEAGSRLRRDLSQSNDNIELSVNQMQSAFHKARGVVTADLKEARAAWQGLAGILPARKGRTEIPREAEAPAAKNETLDLEIKMLTAVREHPEETTLIALAASLGVASVVLGRVSKNLMKKGMIRKEQKLYFPAAGK